MPTTSTSPVALVQVPATTFANAYSTFTFCRFSMGVAEADYNRAPEGLDARDRRRLSQAIGDLYRSATAIQAMQPETDVDIMRREVAVLYAALLRHESACTINARIAGRISADDPGAH
ncbi:hypothetical protein [Aureimonas glaciei]|uniref:Uncharacterized protein n=1 Tax=Aureimonas glaciei TaxID=1776957 RepID=A0A916XXP3_9HYPH|nr:hypothetical protein [Aureimonas glaciei]GGD19905.1 hypothetical protein GCM10011335_23510 [Aureimonas glaciei]